MKSYQIVSHKTGPIWSKKRTLKFIQTLCLKQTLIASRFLWHFSESLGSRRILPLPQSTPTLITKYRAARIRSWLCSWCPWALVLRLTVLLCLASVNLFGGDPAGVALLCEKEYESIDLTPTSALFFWAHKSNPLEFPNMSTSML